MNLLKNKIVIITGGRQGLGNSIAKEFINEGANVAIIGRNQESLDTSVLQMKKGGYENIIGFEADINDRDQCFEVVKKTIDLWGRVDILVNNATDSVIDNSENISSEDWNKVLGTNLSGSFYCSQAVAKLAMLKEKKGSIIMLSSILGLGGLQQRAPYCAAKHGMIGLTKALAVEWGKYNIRVNAICPSYILTPLEKVDVETGRCGYSLKDIEKRTPLGRYSTLEEQARACVWLASDDSSFTTGSVLKTDGGWSAYIGW